jgi:class 3 adenylate cyclase
VSAIPTVCPIHVGRGAEIEQLGAAANRRAVTFIAGEAGVGKSRLGREGIRLATERGLLAFVGNCSPDPTVPYAPFVTAIRRHCRSLAAEDVRLLFDGPAALSANLLPEVVGVVDAPGRTPAPEDLFAAVWQLLRRLSGDNGCLLLLEDLHWADSDSLRLLAYLVRENEGLNVWLVGTYRSDELHRRHPLSITLNDLNRARLYTEISLHPLDLEGLREMVSAIFDGTEVSDEFVSALRDRTSGNPFFVEELVKVLLEEGAIFRESGDWARRDLHEIEMPETVRDALLLRTSRLDPATVEALQIAAMMGERLDLGVLATITGMSQSQVEELVAEGLRSQVLAERKDGPRTVYSFRHALTREALADEVVGPARQRVHLRIAEALQALHQDDPDSVASELAEHFADGGDVGSAVDFGLRAARRATASLALTEAGHQYDQAIRLMDRNDARRLGVLLEAAEALWNHDDRLAKAFGTEAERLARAQDDGVSQSRALLILGRCAWRAGDSQRAIQLATESYHAVRNLDNRQESFVVAHLARVLTLSDRLDEAASLLAGGIPLAASISDDRSLAHMYGTRMLQVGHGREFEEALEASVAAARRANDAVEETFTFTNAGYICLWTGAFDRSRDLLHKAIELAERAMPGDRYSTAGLAWLLSLMGEFDEAKTLANGLTTDSHVPTRMVALTALCEVCERRGDVGLPELVDELWSMAARTGEAQRAVPALAARATLGLRQGLDNAIPYFREALSSTTNDLGKGSHWSFSPALAGALAEDGRVDELDQWYHDVHRLTSADPNDHNQAADSLCLGFQLLLKEDFQGAERALSDSRTRYRLMPCPARETEALVGLAELMWRTDRVAQSLRAAQEAADIAKHMGARYLAEKAAALADRASTPSVLATVLFTDIVGSTERLSSVGDRAWKSVLERHDTLVRRELERWNGREIDSMGDGFLASFDSPAAAVRCALAIRDNLVAAGIQIRAGIHTGECQLSGAKLTGLAVHIAARVSALASAGEVLVSGTVRDLVIGSALRFDDRGEHDLKGVPGRWRLAAVSAA